MKTDHSKYAVSVNREKKIHPIRFDNFKVMGREMVNCDDWQRHYPAEEGGLTNWALRSVLFEKGGRRILIDTGFGAVAPEGLLAPYQLNGGFLLETQLESLGLHTGDIDDIVLTHLHFDHCGGCLVRDKGFIVPRFPNATLWISQQQWDTAFHPSEMEKESFHTEMIARFPNFYKINFIHEDGGYLPGVLFKLVHGHTAGQIIPLIRMGDRTFLFGADLFPSSAHLFPFINMVYDVDPDKATEEKAAFIHQIVTEKWGVIFQHGLFIESCTLKKEGKNIIIDKIFKISDLF